MFTKKAILGFISQYRGPASPGLSIFLDSGLIEYLNELIQQPSLTRSRAARFNYLSTLRGRWVYITAQVFLAFLAAEPALQARAGH